MARCSTDRNVALLSHKHFIVVILTQVFFSPYPKSVARLVLYARLGFRVDTYGTALVFVLN
jgi:hypothetical protein